MHKKSLLLVVLATFLLPFAAVNAQEVTCLIDPEQPLLVEYLEDNYDTALSGEVTQDAFMSAIAEIVPDEVVYPEAIDADGFTVLEAVLTTLYYINVDELAYTYPEDKATAALEGWSNIPEDLAVERTQELAAAIDAGLVEPTCEGIDFAAPVDEATANYLLGRVMVFTGNYKNYLGDASDPDIYSKLIYTWNSFDQVLMPEMQSSANDLIREGVITGYNIKRTAHNANFDVHRSIVYGHANIAHAVQLIGLLRSEDMDAKVMLEPKTSAFLYLAEWGEPTASPSFQVELLPDGNYIAYAKEYDLALEFESMADREAFDAVIKAYAKKDDPEEPGLILGSWFQPLYSSRVEIADYVPVQNNIVFTDQFYIQSFSLTENSDAILTAFEEAYPDADVQVLNLWVNEAFHNYLMGEPL